MVTIYDALRSLVKAGWRLSKHPSNESEFLSSFEIVTRMDETQTAVYSSDPQDFGVTWAEIEAEVSRLQAEHDAKAYARSRATEYPSIGDQLDALFHAGVFPEDMAAKIQAVKDKYPKGGA